MSLHIAHESGYILGALEMLSADYADYADFFRKEVNLTVLKENLRNL